MVRAASNHLFSVDCGRQRTPRGTYAFEALFGLIYATGRGVPQNYFQAVKWFRLAAEQGDALAQYNLGLIYASGYDVVPKDDVQALVWFILAAKGGHDDAHANREAFATTMSPEQVEQAEKFARDWMTTKAQDKAAKCSMVGAMECK
jgi:TPR repeat protein